MKYLNYQVVFREIPNEITLAINITNCPNYCKDCHSAYLANDIGEPLTRDSLSLLIKANNGITCVCFMGGDSSKKQIEQLAEFVREKYPNLLIGWYSGQYELPINIQNFDYIKLGPYVAEKGPLTSSTTNQKMYKVIKDDKNLVLKDITNEFWKN